MSKEENFKLFCSLRGQEVEYKVTSCTEWRKGTLVEWHDNQIFCFGFLETDILTDEIRPIKKPEYKPWNKKTFKFQMVEINGDIFVPVRWDDLGIYIYEGENEDCLCTLYTWEEMVKYCRTLEGGFCGEVVGDE